MNTDWIDVPNWDHFQHYGTSRRPLWIKVYTDLLRKDEYLDLTFAERGMLHGIWLAYADRNGRLRAGDLSAVLHDRARISQVEALNEAGFIGLSASKPLFLNLKEVTRARETDTTSPAVRRARAWIRNGAAREIPREHLAEAIADEFNMVDPGEIADLVALATETA